jgi:hypothetical protein
LAGLKSKIKQNCKPIKEAKDHNEEFKKIFQERLRTRKYFATDSSNMENKPFVVLASIDIKMVVA